MPGPGLIVEVAQKTEIENTGHCHLPPTNLLLANRLQMVVIAINIQIMLAIAKGTLAFDTEPLQLLNQGTAGTGKTFIITAITALNNRDSYVLFYIQS